MLQVVEGDFCTHGINAALWLVKADTRSVLLFGRPFRAVCTAPTHSQACLDNYHHKQVCVPPSIAAAFVETELATLRKRPTFIREVYEMLVLGGPDVYLIIRSTILATAFRPLLDRWAAKTMAATQLLVIAPSLSRGTMRAAADRAVGDATAVRVCNEYAAWLSHSRQDCGYHHSAPLHVVATSAARAIGHLPAELVDAILAWALPASIVAAWRARQKHVLRL